jgi:hypothetical protein
MSALLLFSFCRYAAVESYVSEQCDTALNVIAVSDTKMTVLPLSIYRNLYNRPIPQPAVPRGCAGPTLIHAARMHARCGHMAVSSRWQQ